MSLPPPPPKIKFDIELHELGLICEALDVFYEYAVEQVFVQTRDEVATLINRLAPICVEAYETTYPDSVPEYYTTGFDSV